MQEVAWGEMDTGACGGPGGRGDKKNTDFQRRCGVFLEFSDVPFTDKSNGLLKRAATWGRPYIRQKIRLSVSSIGSC